MRGICPITKCEDDIRKFHIYPKFLWKHLKRTGGTVLAHPTNPVEGCADANPKTELPNDT